MRWDIFCSVVDNYGDAGVAWRLARLLAAEHALDVTLWIDALAPLARMAPAVDTDRAMQRVDGVTVRTTGEPIAEFVPADVIVDAFVGGLPDRYVEAMAAREPRPRWFRLEYLALEPALEAHHGLPSPHPRLPLARTFWVPGFSARSGGLLRERHLFAERDAFVGDASARRAFCASLGIPARKPAELRVSMFCYPHAPLEALLATWSRSAAPITCVVPEGVAADAFARVVGGTRLPVGSHHVYAALTLVVVPFVAQPSYDRLLWECDVNFVRGEDSFVRAQWAAKPFVWHAYPQADDAHAAKIAAFADRYVALLPAPAASAVRALHSAWNGLRDAPPVDRAWRAYEREIAALQSLGPQWAASLATLPELAGGLVNAIKNAL